LFIRGARANNLKSIDVEFQLGRINAVTGVSGSGKSSLIRDVLNASVQKSRWVNCDSIDGLDQIDEVLFIGQESFTTNRLVTPASYTGLLDQIRAEFAKTNAAKELGLKKGDFAYLSKQGKCSTCGGHGKIKTAMDFMSDIWLDCHSCQGMRYNERLLSCKWKGQSIGDVLQMTIIEGQDFFTEIPKINEGLNLLIRLGLGHIRLGQAGNTLSTGEGQRLKLATSLLNKKNSRTLYLFDEPSTGLHYVDLITLQKEFDRIVESGDTIIYIEHNETLISHADVRLTLGPGSGEEGGKLI